MAPRPTNVFAPFIAAAILVVLSGYMTIRLGIAGARFMPTLNLSDPALARAEPILIQPPERLARRVVIVIIDGLRLRDSYGLPFLDSLRRVGVDASASSHYPTFSRPNYVSIVTGVPPRWSGVRTNQYDTQTLIDSLMDRAKAADLSSGYASNYSPALPILFTRELDHESPDGQRYASDFDEMHYVQWPGGFVNATRRLLRQRHPLLVLIHGAVDDAGHEFGADSDEYRSAAHQVDDDLKAAFANIDLDRDTLIVVAYHGHTDSGGHGGLEPDAVEVPLIMAGAGIRAGAAVVDAGIIDVAPTAAALLGVPAPGHALGRTLVEALLLSDDTRSRVADEDQLRIDRNLEVCSASKDEAAGLIRKRRLRRFPFVIALFAFTVMVLVAARRWGALRIDWRVVLIAVPAFPITYYAILGVFGQSFSPSVIPERGDVVTTLFKFGLVSTLVHVVTAWIALRGRVVLRDRLAAANALTVWGLFISLLPAALFWAVFTGPHVDLPSPSQMVLIPATLIAVACFALASTVTLGLEIVIFFARAIDPRVRLRRLERAAARERDRLRREEAAD
jgi:hypothetical protein